MKLNELKAAQKQLLTFVDEFKTFLGRRERAHWCWTYLSGLLLNGERKSIQPLAEHLPGGNEQALQQFVNQSPWVHEQVQLHLTGFLAKHLKVKRGILVLVLKFSKFAKSIPYKKSYRRLKGSAHFRLIFFSFCSFIK